MRIHLIAIGGSIMHNLALCLNQAGHHVSGSDDEIYDPARSRLQTAGLLPRKMGWDIASISEDIDLVILGMHAKKDNPELIKAQELQIEITSFPGFIYQSSREKNRIVVAGSHGKTTTSAMILHIMKILKQPTDYLVGAQLKGFELMVSLTEAPNIVIEGDEYLSSCLDPRPKFLHYAPNVLIITGIAWDHINVFPDKAQYEEQFRLLLRSIPKACQVFYYAGDDLLNQLVNEESKPDCTYTPYEALSKEAHAKLVVFGAHNYENAQAAILATSHLGLNRKNILNALSSFEGASKRLQKIYESDDCNVYLDFAHAPSKVRASSKAVGGLHPDRKFYAVLELHTYSSLNKNFLPEYKATLESADQAIVFFQEHTLEMKNLAAISEQDIQLAFDKHGLQVICDTKILEDKLSALDFKGANLLLMSSGNFGGLDLDQFIEENLES